MGWFSRFVGEINRQEKSNESEDFIWSQLVDFHGSYVGAERNGFPKNGPITKWRKYDSFESIQMPGQSLILCFLDERHPEVVSHVAKIFSATLTRAAKSQLRKASRPLSEGEAATFKGLKRWNKVWSEQFARMQEKYAGTYVLVRRSGDDAIRANFCAMSPDKNLPNHMSFYLKQGQSVWHGSLPYNKTMIAGTIARQSTDKLIEPATISILRSESVRADDDSQLPPVGLILGGSFCGMRSYKDDMLITSSVAMLRLRKSLPSERAASFLRYLDREAEDLINQINSGAWSGTDQAKALFEEKWYKTGSLGARGKLKEQVII